MRLIDIKISPTSCFYYQHEYGCADVMTSLKITTCAALLSMLRSVAEHCVVACSNSVSLTRLSTERKFVYLSGRESVFCTELRIILRRQVFQYLLERVIWTCTLEDFQATGDTVTHIYFPDQQGVRISCVIIRSCCVCSKAIKEKNSFFAD